MARNIRQQISRGAAIGLCIAALGAAGLASAQTAPDATSETAPGAAQGAQTTSPTVNAPEAPVVADANFIVGVGDVVEVGVLGRPETNSRARVAADGTILVPMIGSIQAAGKTQGQLSAVLAQAFERGGYYVKPLVKIEVVSISSRYVTVLGAVGRPGLLPLDRDYRLSEVMARVGGRGAGGADELILTHSDGKSERYLIDRLATGVGGDPILRSGDKIYVPIQTENVFYISGQVRAGGAFPVMPGMTVRMALARSGGLTEMGSEKKIEIVRGSNVIHRAKMDDPVNAGDVITVGERLF